MMKQPSIGMYVKCSVFIHILLTDSVVTALAVMLGLTVIGLVVAILVCVAVIMKWKMGLHTKPSTTSVGMHIVL